MKLKTKANISRSLPVDIRGHHALCEMNFFRMEKLMPGYRNGLSAWDYSLGISSGAEPGNVTIQLKVIDRAPYTTTVEISQCLIKADGGTYNDELMPGAQLVVRLYNDVKMAEIVSWDKHRNWLPQYTYPNKHMYHPDEKLELNRFLGDWLAFCRKQGCISFNNCDQGLVCGK